MMKVLVVEDGAKGRNGENKECRRGLFVSFLAIFLNLLTGGAF
jgi:hypothetical protein